MEFFAKRFFELTTTELYEILKSRAEVFMLEQNIICQDMDGVDYSSLHCFMIDNNRVIAYLRAFNGENGYVKIGRVLTINHGKGFGRMLMDKMPCDKIVLNSQKQAVEFYLKFGFRVVSDEFLEEGVPHFKMELNV